MLLDTFTFQVCNRISSTNLVSAYFIIGILHLVILLYYLPIYDQIVGAFLWSPDKEAHSVLSYFLQHKPLEGNTFKIISTLVSIFQLKDEICWFCQPKCQDQDSNPLTDGLTIRTCCSKQPSHVTLDIYYMSVFPFTSTPMSI